MDPRYLCEWERPDSPTRSMTHAAVMAYYKTHSVRGDARFALRPGARIPADILEGWRDLLAACEAGDKETPTHRAQREALKRCWRQWVGGFAYQVPAPVSTPKVRGRKAPTCCPHCGRMAA